MHNGLPQPIDRSKRTDTVVELHVTAVLSDVVNGAVCLQPDVGSCIGGQKREDGLDDGPLCVQGDPPTHIVDTPHLGSVWVIRHACKPRCAVLLPDT